MSDAQDEVLAMQDRTERKPYPVPAVANSALTTAAGLFRRIEAEPQDEWIVGDVGAYGALAHERAAPSAQPVPADILALRELAARLDGGMAMDEAT